MKSSKLVFKIVIYPDLVWLMLALGAKSSQNAPFKPLIDLN